MSVSLQCLEPGTSKWNTVMTYPDGVPSQVEDLNDLSRVLMERGVIGRVVFGDVETTDVPDKMLLAVQEQTKVLREIAMVLKARR